MRNKLFAVSLAFTMFVSMAQGSYAQQVTDIYNFPINPITCNKIDPTLSCPEEFIRGGSSGAGIYGDLGDRCATSYADFLSDPIGSHYWIEDPSITSQGKADERARQFLYWVLNTNAIDEAPVLRAIWNFSSIISLVGVVLVATIFGIGYIISRRSGNVYNGIGNFFAGGSSGISVGPTIIKIGTMLLYVAFSSAIVFILIQFSEILMRFFFDNLGGKSLFNIYFVNPGDSTLGATELSYKSFIGCRDLNIRVQEGIDAEVFLLKMTNVSYYVLGVMLLLRKILLWFMLFVAPFLALLMPFIFIRNTGWIWIGVFFQWLFYGPLVALFLGAMAKMWSEGIPFSFDFSRAGDLTGYVYPTGLNIVYGGPAQRVLSGVVDRPIGALNNGSYIDTFAEYVITLIMLWAVAFFPWWLLRIFRDYCCEGIYAMKNILLAMYDNMRGGPSKGPSPSHPPSLPSLKIDTKTPTNRDVNVNIQSLNQIKKSLTTDITRSMSFQATRITDVARVETNKQMNQVVNKNLAYISNPVKAKIPAERQQFMNLRSELFNRAIKNDTVARTILASTSTVTTEKSKIRESLIQSLPQTISISQVVTKDIHIPQEAFSKITNSYTTQVTNNSQAVQKLATSAKTDAQTVTNILNTYNRYTSQPVSTIISTIARETNTSEKIVKHVLHDAGLMSAQSRFVQGIASTQKLTKEQVSKVLHSIKSTVLRETSLAERVSSETQTSKENVQSLIKDTFTSAATNTTLTTTVAEKSSTTLPAVQSIMNAFASSIESSSTKEVVQNISKTTNIDESTVSNVLQEASTQIQNHSTLQQTAQKIGVEVEQAKSVVRLAVDATVETAVSSKPVVMVINDNQAPAAQVTATSIQNIFKTTSQDNNTTTTVAQTTHTTQQQVQNVLESYAQHINEQSSSAVTSIATETNMSVSQIKDIMNVTSTTVQNSPQVKEQIVKESKLDQRTVEKIIQSVPASIQTKIGDSSEKTITNQIQTSLATLPQSIPVTSELTTTVIQSLATPSIVAQVAQDTNISSEKINTVIHELSQNLNQSSESLIQSISNTTQLSDENIIQVIQSVTTQAISNKQVVNSISGQTSLPAPQITSIIETTAAAVSSKTTEPTQTIKEQITGQITTPVNNQFTQETVTQIFQEIAQVQSIISSVAQKTQTTEQQVQQVFQEFNTHISESSSQLTQSIADNAHISVEQVQAIMTTTSQAIDQSPEVRNTIATKTNTSASTVQQIVTAVPQAMTVALTNTTSIIKEVAQSSQTNEATSQQIIQSLMNTAVENNSFVENLAEEHQLKSQQIKNILTTYSHNVSQPSETLIQTINQSSGVPKDQVRSIILSLTNSILSSHEIIGQVAQAEGMSEADVSNVMEEQLEVASEPEKHIEKTISIPKTISLEDYEEVKEMWTKHFEEGEVPVSETIKTRKDWIEQEVVYITNTLNKILSSDEKLQQEGLDELGYLLPIFLINNLKGDELIVYLKAKLEAAKLVMKILEHEEKAKNEIKEDEEEEVLVDVVQEETAEEPKHMAIDEEEEEAPRSIEERVKAVQEKLSAGESFDVPEENNLSLGEIKNRLKDATNSEDER